MILRAIPLAVTATLALAILPEKGNAQSVAQPTDPLGCMTAAIYYEAAREPDAGQQAVARVVLNRLADPAFPKSVCEVIFQGSNRHTGCQFTFTCDGAMLRRTDAALWSRAAVAAETALVTPEQLPSLAALNYHADYVRPSWATHMQREARIGRHIFYTRGAVAARPFVAQSSGAAAPAATVFSAWGLPVARLAPGANGTVAVTGLATGG